MHGPDKRNVKDILDGIESVQAVRSEGNEAIVKHDPAAHRVVKLRMRQNGWSVRNRRAAKPGRTAFRRSNTMTKHTFTAKAKTSKNGDGGGVL